MSTPPTELTDITLHQIIGQEEIPVLIDLWAPWCVPCKTLGPTIEKLSRKSQGKIQVAKIDVEKYPEILKEFGVRGIPTLLLFNKRNEVSRQVGILSLGKLEEWLREFDIDLTGNPVIHHSEPLDWPAFYADPQLVEFFRQRLLSHAENKQLTFSFTPFWDNMSGTTSAAFVHSNDPIIFERMTGLPSAVARLIDVCGIEDTAAVTALFNALAQGKDYRLAPHKFINFWLNENFIPWASYIQDEELIAIIERWRKASRESLAGQKPSGETWAAINNQAKNRLAHTSQPDKQLEYTLTTLLMLLSPVPDTRDNELWSAITRNMNYAKFQHIQIELGWTPAERALPNSRMEWFKEKERNTATGKLTQNEIESLRKVWSSENSEFITKEAFFHENITTSLAPYNEKVRGALFQAFRDAADY